MKSRVITATDQYKLEDLLDALLSNIPPENLKSVLFSTAPFGGQGVIHYSVLVVWV